MAVYKRRASGRKRQSRGDESPRLCRQPYRRELVQRQTRTGQERVVAVGVGVAEDDPRIAGHIREALADLDRGDTLLAVPVARQVVLGNEGPGVVLQTRKHAERR